MNPMMFVLAVAACVLGNAFAQTAPATATSQGAATSESPEILAKKVNAKQWLEKEKFTLAAQRPGYQVASTYTVFPTKNEINFGTIAGNSCGRGTLPAVITADNGNISVLVLRRVMPDCEDLQFVFDATTLIGEVQLVNRETKIARTASEFRLVVTP